ncbi:MAG: enoyl-CoA hydratase [Sphingomonas sp. 67-36]|nr:MAG: enoyl-CoA hydratase [Sphingomonas sp. 67-36]
MDEDGGGKLLDRLDSIELIGLISSPYEDPVALLCKRLGIDPPRKVNASMGGEMTMRLIHDAAIAIAKGEIGAAAIVGGEAMNARNKAKRSREKFPWTPAASREAAVRFPSSSYAMSELTRTLGVRDPAQIYPFYEMATQAVWGQTPAEAQRISAGLWAEYADVAARNPSAWIKDAPRAAQIAEVTADNRIVNWPYPKSMVANPSVNMSAAVIVTSFAVARANGVPDDRLVHIWGGAAASEAEDYLQRDGYAHSTAQAVALDGAVELVGGDVRTFGPMELYSCFPVVPKMALRNLGIEQGTKVPPSPAGCPFSAAVEQLHDPRRMRDGQGVARPSPGNRLAVRAGRYVNKHHSLVVGVEPPATPLALDCAVQGAADAARGPVPNLVEDYTGPAVIETYTITYGRDGAPIDGIVILRTPANSRTTARIPATDAETMKVLQSTEASAIGTAGHVRIDAFGKPVWEAGSLIAPGDRPRRYCRVEREGPLTIVTIDRAEAMNALNPAANAEFAEIFDAFAADPDQWVAIITGAGDKAFCAGNDLKETSRNLARGAPLETPVKGYAGLTSRYDLDKPVIAAVNGVAMGGGFEIALACDLIVASDTAVFALPEPKVGLAALAGGLLRLRRQIGLKQAMGMILTGRSVSAAEGRELGFVNDVVPAADLLSAARRWADLIFACSPMSIRASKQIVQRGLDESLDAADRAHLHWPAVKALFRSADMREGPAAFAQKRKPNWTGH